MSQSNQCFCSHKAYSIQTCSDPNNFIPHFQQVHHPYEVSLLVLDLLEHIPKAFSADHGAALLKDGRMFLWGSNRFGQSPGVVSVGICQNYPFSRKRFGANLPWFLRHVFFWQRFCSWNSFKRTRVGELVGFLWWDYFFSSGGHQKSKGDRAPPVNKHIQAICFVIQTPT